MFTPDYWQGRLDQKTLSTPQTQYVEVEKVVVKKEVVKKEIEVPYYVSSGWSPSDAVMRRIDNQNGYPDALRIRAFRELLVKHRKSMVALAVESMYPRFEQKEAKNSRGLEAYIGGMNGIKAVGYEENNVFQDEANCDFYKGAERIRLAASKHIESLISGNQKCAASLMETMAKHRTIPSF